MRLTSMIALLRQLGPRGVARAARERAWSENLSVGLLCNLSDIRTVPAPKIDVSMQPRDPQHFSGFADELSRVTGDDDVEEDQRIRFCEAGVTDLFVATTPEGQPIYAHWLVDHSNRAALHRVTHGMFPDLAPDEALVEGAYTFVAFRSMGALAEGARQLLVKAAERGARRCFTYVSVGNTPALRGAMHLGFEMDHVRVTTLRAGRRHVLWRSPLPRERADWEAATAPRRSPSAA